MESVLCRAFEMDSELKPGEPYDGGINVGMKRFIEAADTDCLENRNPEVIRRLVRFFKPLFWHYFRPVIQGLERIPEGAGMFVSNHNGALLMPDLFIFGMALHERFGMEGLPYGMGHQTGISFPLLHRLFLPIGAVRGSQKNAHTLLSDGHKLLIYPGGELDSMRSYWKRTRIVFGNRRGYLQIALREGVPIIPVVSSGGHETLVILNEGRWLAGALQLDRLLNLKTWPIVFCLPWGLWVGIPPPTSLSAHRSTSRSWSPYDSSETDQRPRRIQHTWRRAIGRSTPKWRLPSNNLSQSGAGGVNDDGS